jgi:hypothetical protein
MPHAQVVTRVTHARIVTIASIVLSRLEPAVFANIDRQTFATTELKYWEIVAEAPLKLTDEGRVQRLEVLRHIAANQGGECLASQYTDSRTKLPWRCAVGHEWNAIPLNVARGHWCMISGNERQGRAKAHTIEMMQKMQLRGTGNVFRRRTKTTLRGCDLSRKTVEYYRQEIKRKLSFAIPASFTRPLWNGRAGAIAMLSSLENPEFETCQNPRYPIACGF